ncbi:unnamed protein product [Somion occarium]|uniref:Uncharacterized protein n=1 Tax=Somion occarium TaxID=3059160 RepID=A0ABP1DPD8_9APHY
MSGLLLEECRLNPLGLESLRGLFQHNMPQYDRYQPQYDQAALAFLLHGKHKDGNHKMALDTFHSDWRVAREHVPSGIEGQTIRTKFKEEVMELVFDSITAWDRITGGTTILIHIDGTLEPDAPVSPEYVKAHVYLNPGLLEDMPETTAAVVRMVQLFIEDIGLPVIRRWFRAFKKEGFSLTKHSTRAIRIPSSIPLIPRPVPRCSTHHIFRGHPTGALDARLASLSVPMRDIRSEVASVTDTDDAELQELQVRFDQMSMGYAEKMEVLEKALHLESSEHRELVELLNYKVDSLKDTLADRDELIRKLRSALRAYRLPMATPSQSAPLSSHSNADIHYGPAISATALPRPAAKRKKAAPIDSEKRKKIKARRDEKNKEVDEQIATWFQQTVALASNMAEKYGQTMQHYLRLFFFGAESHTKKRQPSAYNAYISAMAADTNSDAAAGSASSLIDVQLDHREAYYDLTQKEKDEFVTELLKKRETEQKGSRPNQRSRIQDASAVLRLIEQELLGLKHRVGIEGFFCMVKNNTEFNMGPQWFFTDQEIERYLSVTVRKGWDTGFIGAVTEAFSVAGCDTMKTLTNSKQKATYLMTSIQDEIQRKLGLFTALDLTSNSILTSIPTAEITGNNDAQMQYIKYEKDIVQRYGIELQGWTHSEWTTPRKMSTSLPPLETLLNALRSDACKFVKLTKAQLDAREKPVEKPRKKREDFGKKRKKRTSATDGGNNSGEEDGEEDDAEGDIEEATPPAPKKRRRSKAQMNTASGGN